MGLIVQQSADFVPDFSCFFSCQLYFFFDRPMSFWVLVIGSVSGDHLPTVGRLHMWISQGHNRPTVERSLRDSRQIDSRWPFIGQQPHDCTDCRPSISRPMVLISHAPYLYSVHVHCIHRIWAMTFAGMPTWMHFISAFYSLNMFSSFGVKKVTDVQIINYAILY